MKSARPPNRSFATSVANAFRGVVRFFSTQRNARIHAAAGTMACIAAWAFGLGAWEKVAVVLCIGFVLAAEAFNSAIERLADRVTPEFDPLIREAKDLAAGAVLLAAVTAVAVAVIITLHEILNALAGGSVGN